MCPFSDVTCLVSQVRCQVSGVKCCVLHFACHLSPVSCHLPLMLTSPATYPPPATYPVMHSRLVCKDLKIPKNSKRNISLKQQQNQKTYRGM